MTSWAMRVVLLAWCWPALAQPSLPLMGKQLRDLARGVCAELFLDGAEAAVCRKEFLRHSSRSYGGPSRVELKCQYKTKVIVAVEASEDYQVLLLIPDNNKHSFEDLSYAVPMPNETVRTIYLSQDQKDLRIWSTKLTSRGSPVGWFPGDKIPNWQDVMPTPGKYEIRLDGEFEPDDGDSKLVQGMFSWTSTDPTDQCFEVRNHCENAAMGDFLHKKIDPGEARSFIVSGLGLNDSCTFVVEGRYGATALDYRTPPCSGYYCVPETPKNITVSAHRSGGAWDVRVGWLEPAYAPLYYNVSILANGIRHDVDFVPGNATEVTIRNVVGEDVFTVRVLAVSADKDKADASRHAFFPDEESSALGVVVAGTWAVVLLVVVAVAAAVLALRRRRTRTPWDEKDAKNMASKGEGGGSFSIDPNVTTDPWEIRPDRLVLHEVLGEGAFGVVRRGSLAPGGREVAVKMLKDYPSVEEVRSFRAEMELMKSVEAHPHVVSLAGCCSGSRLMIVAEFCARGDLLRYLRCAWDVMVSKRNAKYYNNNIEYGANYRNDLFKTKQEHSRLVINKLYDLQKVCDTELTPVDLLSFCRQIAMGMEFLASNRVVHRDLAARNVLVSADKTLKIADFGLSRDVYQENQYKQKGSGKLPIKWMALESLTHRIYTSQSDVWSFGVVIWEIVTVGGSPYPGVPTARLPRLLRAGYRMPRPTNCSKQLYELMLSCWREKWKERPTFAELHHQLDLLLSGACADDYMSLELESEEAPVLPVYRSLLPKSMCNWYKKNDIYARPLKAMQSNHYTSSPDSTNRTQLV